MHAIQLYIQYTMQFIAIKKFEALKTLSNCFVMLHYTFCSIIFCNHFILHCSVMSNLFYLLHYFIVMLPWSFIFIILCGQYFFFSVSEDTSLVSHIKYISLQQLVDWCASALYVFKWGSVPFLCDITYMSNHLKPM